MHSFSWFTCSVLRSTRGALETCPPHSTGREKLGFFSPLTDTCSEGGSQTVLQSSHSHILVQPWCGPRVRPSQGPRGGTEQEGLLVCSSLPWPGPCCGLSAVVPRQSSRLQRAPWYPQQEDRQRLQRCVRATALQALTGLHSPQPTTAPQGSQGPGRSGAERWAAWPRCRSRSTERARAHPYSQEKFSSLCHCQPH